MSRKTTVAEVPYNQHTGHMDAYPRDDSQFRPNDPFTATLRIVDTARGRSAARFIAEDTETGVRYPMFMSEVLAIVANYTIVRGEIRGQWIGCKRGANYGIRLEGQEVAAWTPTTS